MYILKLAIINKHTGGFTVHENIKIDASTEQEAIDILKQQTHEALIFDNLDPEDHELVIETGDKDG